PKPTVTQPLGASGPAIQPAHITSVLSAPVTLRGAPGIVLSVAFESTPEPKTHRQLEIFLHELERALVHAASVRDLQMTRPAIVAPVLGWEVANIVLAHQERFDGTGYPYRLQGDRIPVAARMLHLCDAYVAITLAKPYRQARTEEEALREIELGAGTQFDPEL